MYSSQSNKHWVTTGRVVKPPQQRLHLHSLPTAGFVMSSAWTPKNATCICIIGSPLWRYKRRQKRWKMGWYGTV